MTKGEQTEAEAAVERLTKRVDHELATYGPAEATMWHDLSLLLAERMALREVLMPFAHRGENPNAVLHDDDFRRARSALQGNGGG